MCLQKVVKTAKVYTYVKYNAISYIVILYARRLTASQMKQVTTGAHMNTCITLMVVDVTSHLIPIDKHYHSTTPQSKMDTNQVVPQPPSFITC